MSVSLLRPSGLRPTPASDGSRCSVPRRLWEPALLQPAEQFLSRCGKRIRASIVDESYRAAGGVGGVPRELAEGIELLHAGSLIIDDIEDDSLQRRGRPTLHREIGMPLALNTGNWMYFRALEKLTDPSAIPRSSQSVIPQILRTVRRCHEGQALDLSATVHRLEPKDLPPVARAISRLKTGGLTALASWLGATAAGGNALTRKALGRFGMNVGVCLQMHNDLQELRRLVDGENRADDLRNARVTWPWAWAAKASSETETVLLQHRLRDGLGELDKLKEVAGELLDRVGDMGDRIINERLEKELRLLGEHVETTELIRQALSKLRNAR